MIEYNSYLFLLCIILLQKYDNMIYRGMQEGDFLLKKMLVLTY